MESSEMPAAAQLDPVRNLEIGVGFESLFDSDVDWGEVAENFDQAHTSRVAISIGRPEWVAFPWSDHEDQWSAETQTLGGDHDRVAEVIGHLVGGRDRELTLTIDTLSPRMIEESPKLAGVFADGTRSSSFPSATAVHTGEVGEGVEELCAEAATRYRPDRIALTELIGDVFFSDADLELYQSMTHASDFPRTSDGEIDINDAELQEWQKNIIGGLVDRCRTATEGLDITVQMDTRANWKDPGADRLDSGHDYDDLLSSGTDLTVWAYFGLEDHDPEESANLVRGLSRRFDPDLMKRITLSFGLWAKDDNVVSADELAEALEAVDRGPGTISITPLSKITKEHWDTIIEHSPGSTH